MRHIVWFFLYRFLYCSLRETVNINAIAQYITIFAYYRMMDIN